MAVSEEECETGVERSFRARVLPGDLVTLDIAGIDSGTWVFNATQILSLCRQIFWKPE